MNRTFSAIVALFVAGAVVLGVVYFAMQSGLDDGPTDQQIAMESGEGSSAASPDTQSSQDDQDGETQARPAPTIPDQEFAFQRLSIRTEEDRPEACLVFSSELDQTGETNYADYVRLDRKVEVSIRATGTSLCIAGLEYAQSYRATILEGMPAANGQVTPFEETVPIELNDRPPGIAFSGGIILPRDAGGKLPVTTVNVEMLEIEVFRVGDRLLSQLYRGLVDVSELHSYDTSQIENQLGARVWQGQMAVDGAKNETVTTLIPLRAAIGTGNSGVYLVLAKDAAEKNNISYNWRGTAAQWVIDTDLAITSFEGADGLTVHVRSFASAQPQQGIEIALVARNNEILAKKRTGGNGIAKFGAALMNGEGGNQPVVVMAYGLSNDFAYADLRRPAFDLTDRGVDGRPTPGPIDGFVYLDRGIYRPGETVHAAALLRDNATDAIDDAPLTIIARRPDGLEYRRYTLEPGQDGGFGVDVALSATAPRGRWQIQAYVDPDGKPIGRASFDVQDFVPERLKLTLSPQTDVFQAGQDAKIDVEGRFLYGAPASDLSGSGEMRLMADRAAFADYKGFRFGRTEEKFSSRVVPLTMGRTDGEGKTTATAKIPENIKTSYPLRALVQVGLQEPGGRQTREQTIVPVRTRDVYLGIRPAFDGGWARVNTPIEFEIIAVDDAGKAIAREDVTYRLVREKVNYHWYEINGQWRYERQTRDHPVEDGTLTLSGDAPAKTTASLEWGSYRLITTDAVSGAEASIRFWVGWGGSVGADRPDRVAVTLDKDFYTAGEQAVVDIRPPSDGKALITIASDKVHMTRLMDVPVDGATFYAPVEEDWGPGVYVMVSHFRPLSDGPSRAPVRSVGLAYLAVDQANRTLSVELGGPDVAEPQGAVELPIEVGGARGAAYVTISAVDEGILQLTNFDSPSATDHYFGKRRLGLDVRDDYGRLIAAQEGADGTLRFGGDALAAMAGEGLSVVPTKSVALFSGVVALDDQGKANVVFDLPDFVGELRLMAVAWSNAQLGEASRPLTVRQPVVADVTLPRFMAPGDETTATLLVDNVDGEAGTYKAVLSTSGAVSEATQTHEVALDVGERKIISIPISSGDIGIGTVSLSITGPGGLAIARNWPIEVRPAQRKTGDQTVAELAPGETLTLPAERFNAYLPQTTAMSVSLASSRGFDVPGLLRTLDRYPYGCLEQTTSRAYPLLVFNDVAASAGLAGEDGLRVRLQKSVDNVLDMQYPSGGFGMWGFRSGAAYDWLSIYAFEFLLEAKSRDYVVPQDALNRGMSWLRQVGAQSWQKDNIRAYALYVLARQGGVNLSDLRYFHDARLEKIETPLPAAHLGAALALMGDRSRAHSAFSRAVRLAEVPIGSNTFSAYATNLRDLAGVTALVAANGETDFLPRLFDQIEKQKTNYAYMTTQEMAWMLLAAHAVDEAQGPLQVAVEGVPATGNSPLVLATVTPDSIADVKVTNTGDKTVWYTITTEGVPADPLPAMSEGVSITKEYWTLGGTRATLANLTQSDKVVVVIKGRMPDTKRRQMAVMDLLPAGLEIETVLSPGSENVYRFLPALSRTDMASARDDRFIAAFTKRGRRVRQQDGTYRGVIPNYAVAYLARAITPGDYVLPAATVEDMYAPRIQARTGIGALKVAPVGE